MTYGAATESTRSESRTPRRRRHVIVLLGIASAVTLLAIAFVPQPHADPPDTEVVTLPGVELFARATANTEADTDYVVDTSYTSASRRSTTHETVRGPLVASATTINEKVVEVRQEGERHYIKYAETWLETVRPAGRDDDPLAALKRIWPALRAGATEELQRDSDFATYRGTCVAGSAVGRLGWLCDRGSLITITVDIDTERIKSLDATGMMPVAPGRWEQGQLVITIGPPSSAEIPPLETIDTSKIECLARSLDMPLDRAALSERLRDTTTDQNAMLFSGCGYGWFPAGPDYGVK